jgi:predicted enzyme related to lactoylglutathione lyase
MTLTYLQLNNSGIEVISYEGAVVNPIPAKEHLGYRLIALEVDDMDKAAAYLNAKGVQITWGPRTGERYTRAEICDPDGNAIELRQWLRV